MQRKKNSGRVHSTVTLLALVVHEIYVARLRNLSWKPEGGEWQKKGEKETSLLSENRPSQINIPRVRR